MLNAEIEHGSGWCAENICTDHFPILKIERGVDLREIAKGTDGFSGSDLKEMCRDAALFCVRDFVHAEDR